MKCVVLLPCSSKQTLHWW